MPKIDYTKNCLPDIEMYAGNTDVWDFPVYSTNIGIMSYEDLTNYSFSLIIKDFGYTYRSNGPTRLSLTKQGILMEDQETGDALVRFTFSKGDTEAMYGKYTYQIEATSGGLYFTAQGNLFITKNINQ